MYYLYAVRELRLSRDKEAIYAHYQGDATGSNWFHFTRRLLDQRDYSEEMREFLNTGRYA